jgi:hypothetical protein
MEAPDPLLEDELDFLAAQFIQAREGLVALGIPEEAVTNTLRQAWSVHRQARHEAWETARQGLNQGGPPGQGQPPEQGAPQGEGDPERGDGGAHPEAGQDDEDDAQTKKQKAMAFLMGVTVPDAESPWPSEYA